MTQIILYDQFYINLTSWQFMFLVYFIQFQILQKISRIQIQLLKQMNLLHLQGKRLQIRQLFNEQQSVAQFQDYLKSNKQFSEISFFNVGIKIMREAIKIFQQKEVEYVEINYDWNQIMIMPKLVCYDKNKWKTLQQLANWNKQWNQLFNGCLNLRYVQLNVKISWMDDQFVKSFLQGLTRLPNISQVVFMCHSKDQNVQKMLSGFKQAKIFPTFQYKFEKM